MLRRAFFPLCLALVACSNDTPPDTSLSSEIKNYLLSNAVGYQTEEPSEDTSDLAFVNDWIGDAKLVGVGESTRGAAEFIKFKQRLFAHAARELGFRVFLFEANLCDALQSNDYVLGGAGTGEDAARSLLYDIWKMQEVVAQLNWLREYNALNPSDQLWFAGVNVLDPRACFTRISSYLNRLDKTEAAAIDALLSEYRTLTRTPESQGVYYKQPEESKLAIRTNLQAARTRLEARRADFEAASSKQEFAIALQLVQGIIQHERWENINPDSAPELIAPTQNSAITENVLFWLNLRGADARGLFAAHNEYVTKGSGELGAELVTQLQAQGANYKALAMTFYAGRISGTTLTSLTKPLPLPIVGAYTNSYEGGLHQLGLPRVFLNITPSDGSSGASWLSGPRLFRDIHWPVSGPTGAWAIGALINEYDGLVFIDTVQASTPL